MENIQQPNVFENEIELYFNQFCEEQNIENMTDQTQAVFYAALIYVYRHCFKGTDKLKLKGKLQGYMSNTYTDQRSNLNNSNCNAYNYIYLDYIADYYIYICCMYNKIATITGYSKLTGISETYIYGWGDPARKAKLSDSAFDLYKKLMEAYENSGEARLWANKNPVAQLAVMNKRFSWNLPGVSHENTSKRALTAADIRAQLCDNSKQLDTIDVEATITNCTENPHNKKPSKIKG